MQLSESGKALPRLRRSCSAGRLFLAYVSFLLPSSRRSCSAGRLFLNCALRSSFDQRSRVLHCAAMRGPDHHGRRAPDAHEHRPGQRDRRLLPRDMEAHAQADGGERHGGPEDGVRRAAGREPHEVMTKRSGAQTTYFAPLRSSPQRSQAGAEGTTYCSPERQDEHCAGDRKPRRSAHRCSSPLKCSKCSASRAKPLLDAALDEAAVLRTHGKACNALTFLTFLTLSPSGLTLKLALTWSNYLNRPSQFFM